MHQVALNTLTFNPVNSTGPCQRPRSTLTFLTVEDFGCLAGLESMIDTSASLFFGVGGWCLVSKGRMALTLPPGASWENGQLCLWVAALEVTRGSRTALSAEFEVYQKNK